jgi:hypothetical protein
VNNYVQPIAEGIPGKAHRRRQIDHDARHRRLILAHANTLDLFVPESNAPFRRDQRRVWQVDYQTQGAFDGL